MDHTLTFESSTHKTNNRENFLTRVESLVQERGISKTWLSKQLGISKQSLNYILRGEEPKYVSEIATIFNVAPAWLAFGKGEKHLNDQKHDFELIKLYDVGNTLEAILPEASVHTSFIPVMGKNKNNLLAIKIHNYKAMLPTFVDYTTLIFKKDKSPKNGDFIIANIITKKNNPNVVFRKYSITGKQVLLSAISKNYPVIAINQDKLQVLGVLIETRNHFAN